MQCLAGLCWAGFCLASGNYLYELLPGRRLASYMAINSVLTDCGVFVGALTGGWLAEYWADGVVLAGHGFALDYARYGVFACSTLARLLVVLVWLPRLRELRRVRRITARGLIFRFTRLYPPAEMSLQLISSFRRRRRA